VILDSSALLAFLLGESGADVVEAALDEGATCGAANWSEVAHKVRAHGRDWSLSSALLDSYELAIEPVTADDAERAESLWRTGSGLSLGDRSCLALADRLDLDVLTTVRSWGTKGRVRQLRR
jgi:PIN domain nuclease of toxin-antitoxin system